MRSRVSSNVVVAGLAAGLLSAIGCSGGEGGGDPANPFVTQSMAGAAGAPVGQSGAGSVAGTPGAGGSPGTGGTPGAAGTPAVTAGNGGAGVTAGAGGGPTAGTGGGGPGNAITSVAKTPGCGKAPGPEGGQKIATMGTKDAGCAAKVCGAWQWEREYGVWLPNNYDMNKAYPIVFQGPGCGGNYQGIYNLSPTNAGGGGDAANASVDQSVIRIGLTPAPNAAGHGTNPNQGCFDDKEGDDSLDWVFYETLYDHLANNYCFDKNRVFASGNSSGAWFSNELGCKYAGDATRPVRGIMPNTGGLPAEYPQYRPTCTEKPMSGMWVHETGDTTNGFDGNIRAIDRAMGVNNCTMGTTYATAQFDDYPIGNNVPAARCKRIKGCDPLYPLVVCPLPGNGHGSHDDTANPGFATFIKMFSAGEFLTQ